MRRREISDLSQRRYLHIFTDVLFNISQLLSTAARHHNMLRLRSLKVVCECHGLISYTPFLQVVSEHPTFDVGLEYRVRVSSKCLLQLLLLTFLFLDFRYDS